MIGRIDRVYRNVRDGPRYVLLLGRIIDGKLVIHWRGRVLLCANTLLLICAYAEMIAAATVDGQAHNPATVASNADPTLGSTADAAGVPVSAISVAAAPYMRHIAWSIAHTMLGSLGYAAPDQAGGSKYSALGNGVQAQAAQPLCADGKRTGSGSVFQQVEEASGVNATAIRRGGSGSATAQAAVDTAQANSTNTGTEKAAIVAQYRNNTRNASATSWGLTAQAQMPVPAARPHSGDCQAVQTANPAFFGASRAKSAEAVPLKKGASCAAGEVADLTGLTLPGLPAHAAMVLPMGAACTLRTIVETCNALDLASLEALDALPLDEWDALLVCSETADDTN